MDLKQLHAIGAFVPRSLVKRTVPFKRPVALPEDQWPEPGVPVFTAEFVDDSVDVFIKRRTSADFIELVNAPHLAKTETEVRLGICDENGVALFDAESVSALQPWLLLPLWRAVSEVNDFGEKKSMPRTSSGSGSRSPSAAGASRSGRKPSRRKSGPSG